MKIDFVSDVSCPWCAIGLNALEQALDRVAPDIQATLHFQPFELNPQMGPEGQDIGEHLQEKYGATPEQGQKNREAIAARGAALGFTFSMDKRSRIYKLLAKVATLLCAIRAEARGNVHVGGNASGQRAWIEKNAALATGIGGRSLQRRQERFEVVLREGDAVEVEGALRREPLPSGMAGGYRDRTDCWAVGPGPDGVVRVVGVGASAPVAETEVRKEALAVERGKTVRAKLQRLSVQSKQCVVQSHHFFRSVV